MSCYYDTGVFLKLYTEEPDSAAVRAFVTERGEEVRITELHLAETVSALRLKQFRGECGPEQASAVLGHVDEDRRAGTLVQVAVDWPEAWRKCHDLACAHAGTTGCRTLDTLHVACAKVLGAAFLVSTDRRQSEMATEAGLNVIDPTR